MEAELLILGSKVVLFNLRAPFPFVIHKIENTVLFLRRHPSSHLVQVGPWLLAGNRASIAFFCLFPALRQHLFSFFCKQSSLVPDSFPRWSFIFLLVKYLKNCCSFAISPHSIVLGLLSCFGSYVFFLDLWVVALKKGVCFLSHEV